MDFKQYFLIVDEEIEHSISVLNSEFIDPNSAFSHIRKFDERLLKFTTLLILHRIVRIDRLTPRLCDLSLDPPLHHLLPHVLDALHKKLLEVASLVDLCLVSVSVALEAFFSPFEELLELGDLVGVCCFQTHHVIYYFLFYFVLR